jgi:hypothetical protein
MFFIALKPLFFWFHRFFLHKDRKNLIIVVRSSAKEGKYAGS